MPANYVDNAQNRKLGRVGMPRGSAVVAGGATSRGGNMGSALSHSAKTYVDNASNQRLGRVGMPLGSMPVSKGTTDYNVSRHSAKTYADNAANQILGRAGMPLGSMPVSKDTTDNNVSTHSAKTYADNAANQRLGRAGMPLGSMPVSKGTTDYNVSTHSANTYADNAANQRLGRAGMSLGSMPVSKDTTDNNVSRHSAKTYVDNAANQRLGRVGMPLGSMPVSKDTTDNNVSTYSAKTYADNAANQRLGRAGMPLGSMPVSKDTTDNNVSTHSAKTYADNVANQRLGRAGMPLGSMPVSKDPRDNVPITCLYSSNRPTHVDGLNVDEGAKGTFYVNTRQNRELGRVGMPHGEAVFHKNDGNNPELATRLYKNNALSRRLGRVGQPIGSAVFSSKTKSVVEQKYENTSINIMLGRVGKPRGSMPLQKCPATKKIPEMIYRIANGDEFKEFDFEGRGSGSEVGLCHSDEALVEAFDQAMYQVNRQQEEIAWQDNLNEPPKTIVSVLKDYQGKKIPFADIKLHRKIGRGGFGEVYFAKWNETVVAVKRIQKEKISSKRIKDFAEEVMTFCTLNHPNIVKFIGACVETTVNTCIVMEYMQMSLYDAIHIRKEINFTELERIGIIQQICDGMKYLHFNGIAHCDLKSANILMDYIEGHICEVKITDFGLSMIKRNDTLSSASTDELVYNIGTPRYSSPEILRGELLSAKDMMIADVYGLSLIFLEIIFEEEPFSDFTYQELKRCVGDEGLVPKVPQAHTIEKEVMEIIQKAWSSDPSKRPNVAQIYDVFRYRQNIYTGQ